jgi:formylmethanofuran dehydrogenase subunit E
MVNLVVSLESERESILKALKNLTTSQRSERHKLLDQIYELDTRIMIARSKQGESECDGCGKWRKLRELELNMVYHVCEDCYEAEKE